METILKLIDWLRLSRKEIAIVAVVAVAIFFAANMLPAITHKNDFAFGLAILVAVVTFACSAAWRWWRKR